MINFRVKYANDNIIVIQVNESIYYIRTLGIALIYDSFGQVMNVPNVDTWLAANTHNRYSYQSLCDMASAFKEGMNIGFNKDYIEDLVDDSIAEAVHVIMRKGLIAEYALTYWIEVLDNASLESYLHKIRDHFDKLVIKHRMGLYNDLCRIYEICEVRQCAHLLEISSNLIKRLGKEFNIPKYPDTSESDNKVITIVKNTIKIDAYQSPLQSIISMADRLAKLNLFVKT